MIIILTILAIGLCLDLLSGGTATSSIISSFHTKKKVNRSETEILNDVILDITDDLDYLQDELSEAIDEEDEATERRIREKIITKKQILKVYLDKLGRVNEN